MKKIHDWITLIIGIWLILSPWILRYHHLDYAWNSYISGALVAVLSIFALKKRNEWIEWVNMIIGLWLFFSPWLLGMIAIPEMWNHWIAGILIAVASGLRIMEVRKIPIS